jgi:hypothetical protein
MAAYATAAEQHPWGGRGPDRLVVAPIVEGSFVDAIERYMARSEFEAWWAGLGPEIRTIAKTFRAADGKVTTVIVGLPFAEAFLYGFAHQTVEAAGLHRQLEEGYVRPTEADGMNAHVLWRHYAVERARRELTDAVGLPLGDFDNTELVSEAKDVERVLTEAAERAGPHRGLSDNEYFVWMMMLRVWAAGLGCADAGATPYALELHRFDQQPYVQATYPAWTRATGTLRSIWASPERLTHEQDAIAEDGLWQPALGALRDLWQQLISA